MICTDIHNKEARRLHPFGAANLGAIVAQREFSTSIVGLSVVAEERLEEQWERNRTVPNLEELHEESDLFEHVTMEHLARFTYQVRFGHSRCENCARHESRITEGFDGDLCIDKCADPS